jgi:sarcosine oxidase, subunit gamma
MFDISTVMQSPLHHFEFSATQVPPDKFKGVWANEIALQGYINLRGDPQNTAFLQGAEAALGCALPIAACSLVDTRQCTILWLAPDEWLLVCARERRAELQAKLETTLAGIHSQVVDNSGGFTSVLLQGKNARDALSHCTVYDLHALTAGKVVGSTFGKVSCYLHAQDDGQSIRYVLIFRRSFADYIWRYLARAAAPYGFGIALLETQK